MQKFLSGTIVCLLALMLAPGAFGQGPIDLSANNAEIFRGEGGQNLTPPSQAAPLAIVADFLRSQSHGEPTINSLVVVTENPVQRTGLTHLRIEQQVGGLKIYGTYVKATLNGQGELVHLIELVAAPPARVLPATVSARAVLDAVVNLYYPGRATGLAEAGRAGNTVEFSHDGFFFKNPTVTRVAVAMAGASMQQGFLVETWTNEDNLLHHTVVGRSGRILSSELRTANDTYHVFTEHPVIDFLLGAGPIGAPQTTVDGPDEDGVVGNAESPDGWLSTDGRSTGIQTTFRISGNNTDTYLDTDTNNSPDAGGTLVTDGNFTTAADLTVDPSIETNKKVSVQNLFYTCNLTHDKLYKHGFTEAAGNFQETNFTGLGEPGDSVLCEAQDGSGLNNANFATPSDGSNPRMQMFLWDQSNPKRGGDVDADIVEHEYGHGLTFRMIGGMSGCMSGAIGEGMSDVLAILLNNDDIVAEYSFNNPVGIRSAAYTDYDRTYGNTTGSSVHFNGEIYAAIIWRLWEKFQSNGISQDTLFDYLVDGMNSTPSGPAFENMRDGILAAAAVADECLIWEAFAEFGVGVGASGSCRQRGPFFTDWAITESFDVISQDPEATCDDGVDNDCDTFSDCADSDCAADPACSVCDSTCGDNAVECAEVCDSNSESCGNLGFVDDGTSALCKPDCTGFDDICTACSNEELNCSDLIDNDCDGLIDGNDPDCQADTCVNSEGLPADASCTDDTECCSNKCKGGGPQGKKCKE